MKAKPGKIISQIAIWLVVLLFALSCLLPLLNMVAISLSGSDAVAANKVGLWPVDFTITTYNKLLGDSQFWHSFWISVKRVVIGTLINMFFTISMAYPLSKSKKRFRAREIYMKIVIFAMLFNGGIIPLFMVVSKLHLNNTIWSLVLPGAVPVFNVILLINFFKGVPESLDEAARIDGASELYTFHRIAIPIMSPGIATMSIMGFIGGWNAYLLPMIILNKNEKFTLPVMMATLRASTDITANQGAIYLAVAISVIPILLVFAFFSKYIISSISAGAVKE